MITLAAADTLAAVGSVASMLTSTIIGSMELNAGVEVYKVLDQRQLAAAAATIYTAPASTQAFIRSIVCINNDTVIRTARYFRGGTAAANAISPTMQIPPQGAMCYEDGMGWFVIDANGQVLSRTGANPGESNFRVSGIKAETIPRHLLTETNTAALVSGRLQLQLIWLTAGTIINNLSAWSATTALGTGTNQIFGLYDTSLNRLAFTVNDGATAWAANTQKTLALSSPAQYIVPTTGLYYIGIMVAATTVPTLKGQTAPTATSGPRGAAPMVTGSSSTGLTTTIPDPAGAMTATTTPFWMAVT